MKAVVNVNLVSLGMLLIFMKSVDSSLLIATQTWVHLAVTQSDSTMKFYMDGRIVGSSVSAHQFKSEPQPNSYLGSNCSHLTGAVSNPHELRASVENLQFFTAELSQAQIIDLIGVSNYGTLAAKIHLFWPFNDNLYEYSCIWKWPHQKSIRQKIDSLDKPVSISGEHCWPHIHIHNHDVDQNGRVAQSNCGARYRQQQQTGQRFCRSNKRPA